MRLTREKFWCIDFFNMERESISIELDDFEDLEPDTSINPPPYYEDSYRSRNESFTKILPPDLPLGTSGRGNNPPPPGYTYAVISHQGFQKSELLIIMSHLTKVEIFLSIFFVIHGSWCPGSTEVPYKGVCHTDIVSGMAGILAGGIGMAALTRYRWKTMMVASLILAIISSVGCLVVVVNLAIWLDHLGKMDKDGKTPKEGSGIVRSLSVFLMLVAVAAGVCYILSSTFICHHWTGKTTRYHMLSKITKRKHTENEAPENTELLTDFLAPPQMEMQTMHYQVSTPASRSKR